MASRIDTLARTLLDHIEGHIDQENGFLESEDSFTSTDDSQDSPNEEPTSESQLKITKGFQSGHKRRRKAIRTDSTKQKGCSIDGDCKEPRSSINGAFVRPTSAKRQRKMSFTSRKSPSTEDSEYTPQRSKSTSRRQLLGNEKSICSIFDFETSDDSQQNPILSALMGISSTLNNLVNRVENTEKDNIKIGARFK